MARRKTPYAPVLERRGSRSGGRLVASVRLAALLLVFVAAAGAGWVAHFARTSVEVPPTARMFEVEQGISFRGYRPPAGGPGSSR